MCRRARERNQALASYVRDRRLSRGLGVRDAAQLAGVDDTFWWKLEAGQYAAPKPAYLQAIARALDVPFEDLYALVGYDAPERLPSLRPYLRARYNLPPNALIELERYFEMLRNYYGIPTDRPVYPPKPKHNKEPRRRGSAQKRRAA